MQNITSVGDQLFIQGNPLLTNLTPLQNISCIAGPLYIDGNNILSSLSGLDNIECESIYNLTIINNPYLSTCEVLSICDYLVSPTGETFISNNGPGCNNPEEVELACQAVSIKQEGIVESFTISPNPCSGAATLQLVISDRRIVICELFTISGVKIKELIIGEKIPGSYEIKIDMRDLPAGIYYCVLQTDLGTHSTKMIKL